MAPSASSTEREATPIGRRHLFAAVLGNGLEFYDFVVYGYFAIQIGHAFFPAHDKFTNLMLSLATFGAGFITRPIGALVIGAYADGAGRRAAMMLCFILMGVAIVGMAVIPTYAAIGVAAPILAVLTRMLQGFSLGGEVGSNTAYLVEAASPQRRGLITAWQGASQGIASVLGSGVGLGLASTMGPQLLDAYGWRIAFLLGAITVPFGLLLRRSMPETLHAAEVDPHVVAEPAAASLPRRLPRVVWLGLVILGGGTITTYVVNYMTTFAQDTLHLGARISFAATLFPNLMTVPAVLLGGWLSDRYGRRPVMIWPQLARVILILPIFYLIVSQPTAATLLVGLSILGALSGLTSGAFYAALSESLAKRSRGQSFSLTYSLAIAVFGGTTQLIVTWLIHLTGQSMAPGAYMAVAALAALVAMIAMRESAPVKRMSMTAMQAAPA